MSVKNVIRSLYDENTIKILTLTEDSTLEVWGVDNVYVLNSADDFDLVLPNATECPGVRFLFKAGTIESGKAVTVKDDAGNSLIAVGPEAAAAVATEAYLVSSGYGYIVLNEDFDAK